jgi:hypothetical protein
MLFSPFRDGSPDSLTSCRESATYSFSSFFLAYPTDSQGTSSSFYFNCTPATSFTIHFLHRQFSHLQISLHTFPYYRNPPMGPQPSTCFFTNLRHPQAKPSYIGAPISVSALLSQLFFNWHFVIKPLFPASYIAFCRHLWRPSSFLENTTHVTLGWGIPYHLLPLTSSINPEYPTGHLSLFSEFVHFVPPLAQLYPTSSCPPDTRPS